MRIGTAPVSSAAIAAALGFMPLDRAGDTMTGKLTVNVAAGDPLDIQIGGTSRLQYVAGIEALKVAYATGWGAQLRYVGMSTRSTGYIGWSSSDSADGTIDLGLWRDAANASGQRNGVNPQAWRLYNTYTDASNYERGEIAWVANALTLRSVSAGTGSPRLVRVGGSSVIEVDDNLGLISAYRHGTSSSTIFAVLSSGMTGTAINHTRLAPSINQSSGSYSVLDINPTETAIGAGPHYLVKGRIGGGAIVFGFDNAGRLLMQESADPVAPPAGNATLYVRDNGSGKTQLVARFPTGAVQVVATEP
ncbi:hypothetical protein [Reyranella sp.]|uniref:hypothetical protein n=1 Tax=Reyranella sp. TaxID=1929291 RepID=UPI003BA9FBA6